jgi:Ni/Co efflux regulator RcnB
MKKLISAVALAAMVGAGQLAVAAPVQAAGLPHVVQHSNDHRADDHRAFTFKKGKRLPSNYKRHYVDSRDYHRLHLKTPPRGYRWVKEGNTYMMIAITSGVIGAILGAIAASH